jgi:hypothetical protein
MVKLVSDQCHPFCSATWHADKKVAKKIKKKRNFLVERIFIFNFPKQSGACALFFYLLLIPSGVYC